MKYLKKYSIFESKDNTRENIRSLLFNRYGITSEDIKEWCVDILDDYPELDIRIEILEDQLWIIFTNTELDRSTELLSVRHSMAKKYHVSEETLNFLNSRLKEYNLHIPTQVYYYSFYFTICVEQIVSKPIMESFQ